MYINVQLGLLLKGAQVCFVSKEHVQFQFVNAPSNRHHQEAPCLDLTAMTAKMLKVCHVYIPIADNLNARGING